MRILPVLSHFANTTNVLIADEKAPIIVPFGPAYSGKTNMLCRLFYYLGQRSHYIKPNPMFVWDNLSSAYEETMDNFFDGLSECYIPRATTEMPLFFDVLYGGNLVCHILDQAGTSHFNKNDVDNPVCLEEIFRCPNKKVWLFVLDSCWEDENVKQCYIERIIDMKTIIDPHDKVIFVATKADMFFDSKNLFYEVKSIYSRLFDVFKNTNPITRLIRPYNFDFVAFSAGTFSKSVEETGVYSMGDNKYPEALWNTITKSI